MGARKAHTSNRLQVGPMPFSCGPTFPHCNLHPFTDLVLLGEANYVAYGSIFFAFWLFPIASESTQEAFTASISTGATDSDRALHPHITLQQSFLHPRTQTGGRQQISFPQKIWFGPGRAVFPCRSIHWLCSSSSGHASRWSMPTDWSSSFT